MELEVSGDTILRSFIKKTSLENREVAVIRSGPEWVINKMRHETSLRRKGDEDAGPAMLSLVV